MAGAFDVGDVLGRVREAVRPYPKAALFDLAESGHASVFAVLVGCVISVRTRDEVTLPAARRLLAAAPTPAAVAALTEAEVAGLIRNCTFPGPKAGTIREIARRAVADHAGELPPDPGVLTGFKGVGPKCAHLAAGIAAGVPAISVDVHVHRVTNRWGYVAAPTPEKTMAASERVLPREFWVEINALLVPFGKHVCTSVRPRCSACPVADVCRRVGVTAHR